MPSPTKPAVLPIWTQGNTGARTQPTNGEQLAGFVPNFRPPAGWHNWLFGIMSDWIAWFDYNVSPSSNTVVASAAPSGPIALPVRNYLGNPAGGSYAVPLANAAANLGLSCTFTNISATNNLTITVQTGEYLQGTLNGTTVLGPNESITLTSDGLTGYWQTNS